MTSEEARECFSAAYDAQLDPRQQQDFERALADDTALAAEYQEFCLLLRAAGGADDAALADAPVPDLLAGVQRRLRVRSRGRFYGDRFAERAGLGVRNPLLVLAALLIVAGLAWAALSLVHAIQM